MNSFHACFLVFVFIPSPTPVRFGARRLLTRRTRLFTTEPPCTNSLRVWHLGSHSQLLLPKGETQIHILEKFNRIIPRVNFSGKSIMVAEPRKNSTSLDLAPTAGLLPDDFFILSAHWLADRNSSPVMGSRCYKNITSGRTKIVLDGYRGA